MLGVQLRMKRFTVVLSEELVRLESGELRPTAVELYAARALIGLDGIGPNNEKSKVRCGLAWGR